MFIAYAARPSPNIPVLSEMAVMQSLVDNIQYSVEFQLHAHFQFYEDKNVNRLNHVADHLNHHDCQQADAKLECPADFCFSSVLAT
jgi:hypothetical protein